MRRTYRLFMLAALFIGIGLQAPTSLADDPPATKPTPEKMTALFKAMEARDWKAAMERIEANPALARVADPTKRTPLHFAALHGNEEAVASLLKLGAMIERKDPGPLECDAERRRNPTAKHRVLAQSAASFAATVERCTGCGVELDDLLRTRLCGHCQNVIRINQPGRFFPDGLQ